MRYQAMWHPEQGWGPTGVPVLMERRSKVVAGTGLTLRKMRELGWRWVTIDVPDPVPLTAIARALELQHLIIELTEEHVALCKAELLCPGCASKGFAVSRLGPDGCEFCDGTESGNPPTEEEIQAHQVARHDPRD